MALLVESLVLGSGIFETNLIGNVARAETTFTIYAQAYSGGVISPSGSISVPQGGSQTFTITPNSGYIISCLAVDGNSIIPRPTEYTFSNVQANHNIYVSFKVGTTTTTTPSSQTTYTLTIKAPNGSGTTSPTTGTYTYAEGSSAKVSASSASGYAFSYWILDGENSGSTTSFTVTMNANHAIQAVFEKTEAPAATLPSSEHVREIWKDGNTYYATGGRQSTSFSSLWSLVHRDLVAGDTVHFAGYTDYVTSTTIALTKSDITITGDPGAFIRAYSSNAPSSYLFDCRGDRVKIIGMGFSGLGVTDNRDMTRPYLMVHFEGADNVLIEGCTIVHTQQYLLCFVTCDNFVVRNNLIRYGQNGISTQSAWNYGGIIEYNEIRDCSQGPIKLRWCDGTIVRYNNIHLEYTYWKNFVHPGYSNGAYYPLGVPVSSGGGSQGIYFGTSDGPSRNCDIYGNTITDSSTDSYGRPKFISYGCRFTRDGTYKSYGNKFHDNTVTGAYWGVWVENYTSRSPQPITVYDNTLDVYKNQCYFTY